ncbi:MAG: Bacterial lipid biosynthesis acyltransferase [Gaiellaceae bacterium]|nr:Bacterial lipid biosynthesis acyltransferase [Gaiellaceae bacterium]
MEDSLERRLNDLERPRAHLSRLTGQTLPVRLYASGWFHRTLPTPVALRLAALRGRLEWHVVPSRRYEAIELTRAIRGYPDERAARRRLVEDAVRAEVQWRPWLYRRMPVEGLEHLEQARAASKGGLILATIHVGAILGLVHALAARGLKLYLPGGEWGIPTVEGLRGRWIATQNRWVEEAGARWVPLGESYPVLRALLERGEVCMLAVDVPGDVEVELAGRPARVRGGLARLALETGSPILPIATLRVRWGMVGFIGEPIDPATFDDPVELTRYLVAAQEPRFVGEPEQVHSLAVDVWDDDLARTTRPKVGR